MVYSGSCADCTCRGSACTGPTTRVGPYLTALLTYMRETLGSSYRKLSHFSSEIAHIALTPAASGGAFHAQYLWADPACSQGLLSATDALANCRFLRR